MNVEGYENRRRDGRENVTEKMMKKLIKVLKGEVIVGGRVQ